MTQLKNLFALALLILFGCTETPSLTEENTPPELLTLETYENYLDTVGVPHTDTAFAGTFGTEYPVTIFYEKPPAPMAPVEQTVADTVPAQDTLQALPVVDSLNQVLGISDLIFVWEGDTTTTAHLGNFLRVFEGNCLTENVEVVKSHIVFLMFTGLTRGDPTGGASRANDYLNSVLPCGGLSEYLSYSQLYEQQ